MGPSPVGVWIFSGETQCKWKKTTINKSALFTLSQRIAPWYFWIEIKFRIELQSNVSTTAALGTEESDRCGEVAVSIVIVSS